MARRPRLAGSDPLADLAKKCEILEQELAAQRAAMERLRELGRPAHLPQRMELQKQIRRSA